jgi:dTDP-4-amino-4,6-dideoxygalactose transaminase
MVVLSNPTIADDIRRLRNHGSTGAYIHESVGFNSRLDEIQAGILLIKLKRINTYNALRKQKAALYNELLSDSIQRPLEKPGMTHVYHQYTIRSKKRDLFGPPASSEGGK